MVNFRATGRWAILIVLASALAWGAGAMAAAGAELYRAQAIVTGQGEANRIIGFASCLEDVLIMLKVLKCLRLVVLMRMK